MSLETEDQADAREAYEDAKRRGIEWQVCDTCGKDFMLIGATSARRKAKPCICFECWKSEDRAARGALDESEIGT